LARWIIYFNSEVIVGIGIGIVTWVKVYQSVDVSFVLYFRMIKKFLVWKQ